jgi:predicted metal-dependent hydrolase
MIEYILILVIIIFIYIFLFINQNNVIYIKANNGTKFLVHKDIKQQEKANLLGQLVQKLYILKNHMVNNKKSFSGFEEYIDQLSDNFNENRTIIYETDPTSNLTSYSVNKGEELSFCLHSKKTKELHDINLLMYVAIHEMSHIACPEIGHGDLFKKIFKKFVEEAISIGIYKKIDYSSEPAEYCGMILSSSIV